MYASYFYKAGATETDVFNDIIAILTGETNVNNLSASCDKTNTQIKTDYSPSGWSLENLSGSQAILSSPHTEDNTRKKLLVLNSSTFSSGYLKVGSAKSYNPSSGLRSTYFLSSSFSPKIDLANGGRLEIYADPKIVLFLSYTGGVFSDWAGVCETRLTPYDNKGWVVVRDLYVIIAEATGFSGSIYSWTLTSFRPSIGRVPERSDTEVEAARIFVAPAAAKIITELPSVYKLPDNFGAIFDTIDFPDGKTYVIWSNNGGGRDRVAIPWG